jgi:hypothetical protein
MKISIKKYFQFVASAALLGSWILLNILFSNILRLLSYHGDDFDSLLGCNAR